MNALAALVSYLPAADPSVRAVAEGLSEISRRALSEAAARGRAALRLGAGVTAVARGADGRYLLNVTGDAGE